MNGLLLGGSGVQLPYTGDINWGPDGELAHQWTAISSVQGMATWLNVANLTQDSTSTSPCWRLQLGLDSLDCWRCHRRTLQSATPFLPSRRWTRTPLHILSPPKHLHVNPHSQSERGTRSEFLQGRRVDCVLYVHAALCSLHQSKINFLSCK